MAVEPDHRPRQLAVKEQNRLPHSYRRDCLSGSIAAFAGYDPDQICFHCLMFQALPCCHLLPQQLQLRAVDRATVRCLAWLDPTLALAYAGSSCVGVYWQVFFAP